MSEENKDMRIEANRAKALASNLKSVSERVTNVAKGRNVRLSPLIITELYLAQIDKATGQNCSGFKAEASIRYSSSTQLT
jgi:hypothetical protein